MTHYMMRYPAKFHPPVVRVLLRRYTKRGQTVLDPFCGSGTLLVEALAMGRHGVGADIDPVAVFASTVKTSRPNPTALEKTARRVLANLEKRERSEKEYRKRMFQDLNPRSFERVSQSERLSIPRIPNLTHWFRRYVIVDLARIRRSIRATRAPKSHKAFLMLCFAAIIRGASNADPVPVSGLEVTSHMLRRDKAGRLVNPFALFRRAVESNLQAVREFVSKTTSTVSARVYRCDATLLSSVVRDRCHAVITSPPYHNAVDYYRRHTLEMFWLDQVRSADERRELLPHYIGRATVPQSHPYVNGSVVESTFAKIWEDRLRAEDPRRADAFKHYIVAMGRALEQVAQVLRPGGYAVFVVGNSTWNGTSIPTADLFAELAVGKFRVVTQYWYRVKNRYMSYTRRNGANIDREYVLVLKRAGKRRRDRPG